jgi:hypothetical protein
MGTAWAYYTLVLSLDNFLGDFIDHNLALLENRCEIAFKLILVDRIGIPFERPDIDITNIVTI